ncbi:MAG: hypothetical protein KatS3mg002_1403 [Candidatus Woesearchaeota archaeon]|nr:MAG: hypothetical protein KatS3mg002_1403 [Candidatus Woesearchaeota archaeon]
MGIKGLKYLKWAKDLVDGHAWGKFNKAGVILAEAMRPGTEYHEAFHFVFHLYLTHKQREKILDEASKRFNIPRSKVKEKLGLEKIFY